MSSDRHDHIARYLADTGKLAWGESLENVYFHWS